MAVVPVTISGMLYHKAKGEGSIPAEEAVTLIGYASITGLGVGGGPIVPPDEGPKPPWGGVDKPPVVAHPIWPPTWPGHPIELPPFEPPPDGGDKPPPEGPLFDWKVAWTPNQGWILVAIPKFDVPVPS